MPYDDLIDSFKEGDVIYGLHDHLLAVADLVRQPREIRKRAFPIFGKKQTKATGLLQADITNAVWDRKDPTRYATDKEIKKALVNKALGVNFREHLNTHEKYNVASDYEKGNLRVGDEDTDLRTAWGRTSKAGIEYHLTRGATVHFVATGVRVEEVATKTGTGSKEYITSKELRWLHRNRNEPAVKERVKFYTPDEKLDTVSYLSQPAWEKYVTRGERQQTRFDDGKLASGSNVDPKQYWSTLASSSASGQRASNSEGSVSSASTMCFHRP